MAWKLMGTNSFDGGVWNVYFIVMVSSQGEKRERKDKVRKWFR